MTSPQRWIKSDDPGDDPNELRGGDVVECVQPGGPHVEGYVYTLKERDPQNWNCWLTVEFPEVPTHYDRFKKLALPRPKTACGPLTLAQHRALVNAGARKLGDVCDRYREEYASDFAVTLDGHGQYQEAKWYKENGWTVITFEQAMDAILGAPVPPPDETPIERQRREFVAVQADPQLATEPPPCPTFTQREIKATEAVEKAVAGVTSDLTWKDVVSLQQACRASTRVLTESERAADYNGGAGVDYPKESPKPEMETNPWATAAMLTFLVSCVSMIILASLAASQPSPIWLCLWLCPVAGVTCVLALLTAAYLPPLRIKSPPLLTTKRKELCMNPLTCSFRAVRWGAKGTLWGLVIYLAGFLISFGRQQADVVTKAAAWPEPMVTAAKEVAADGQQAAVTGIDAAQVWAAEDADWGAVGICAGTALSALLALWTALHVRRRNRERDERDRQRDGQVAELLALVKTAAAK